MASPRFNFEWQPETINPDLIDINKYELVYIPKENIPLLDDRCKICIHNQVKKYDGFLDQFGEPINNRFIVQCKGILKDPIPPYIRKSFAGEDPSIFADIESIYDPCKWAEVNVRLEDGRSWIPRFYQNLQLRCTASRKTSRLGRRSGKSDQLAVFAIHACVTQPFIALHPETGEPLLDAEGRIYQRPTRILIATPRQSHADNLMGKIRAFVESSERLCGVPELVKSPYYVMTFPNGSKIICVTTGAGTSGSGVNIRGFDADIMLFDEANYLGEEDLKAALAILGTNTGCQLWAVSTPKGIQDFFWNWCKADPTYKEFHYPTMVVPNWNLIKAQILADVQTEDEFLHEWMAEFSAASEGVFRMDLVMEAAQPYKYTDCLPDHISCTYAIGVDWNSTAGTEIVVVGYNHSTGIYSIVESENIAKATWTQLDAMQRVLELGAKWDAQLVYIDAGYGAVQEELFRLLSEQAKIASPDSFPAKLNERLFSYDFSKKIEIKDPSTGRRVKKHAKPFLVENTVRRFEERNLVFPAEDTLLHSQLSGYIVASISAAGVPVYKAARPSIGDHRLDAMMLALVGFKLNLSNFSTINNAPGSMSLIPGGQGEQKKKREIGDRTIPEKQPQEIQVHKNLLFVPIDGLKDVQTLFGMLPPSNQAGKIRPVKPSKKAL